MAEERFFILSIEKIHIVLASLIINLLSEVNTISVIKFSDLTNLNVYSISVVSLLILRIFLFFIPFEFFLAGITANISG